MLWQRRIETVPEIHTNLPGPRSQSLIESDEQYTSPSYTRVYPLAVRRASGVTVEDMDGNRFLDFTAGIAVCSTGHCHPRVVRAIQQQAAQLMHMSGTDFYYGPQRHLAQKLAEIAPGTSKKSVFFTNSGTEAVEAAFKLARHHTRRQHIIAFYGAFHGRTMGALSLTASKVTQRRGFSPLVPCVTHIDYPRCFRCPVQSDERGCCFKSISDLEETIFGKTVSPDEVAAVFVEPILGEGGYVVPPDGFHQRLKALAEKHEILFIADEVQTGMGRTGKMFAMEHWGVEPDVICLAKGIASGMPLGAIVAKAEVMDWDRGSHASTFGGNPVCCAAALETIALLEEGLTDHAARVGKVLLQRLRQLQAKQTLIGDVRGQGLMIGAELVKDRQSLTPATSECNEVVQRCFRKGLLLLSCGESTLRFCPPLIVTEEQVEIAIGILDEALTEVTEKSQQQL